MAGLQPLTTARARARLRQSAAATVAVVLLGAVGVVGVGLSPAGAAVDVCTFVDQVTDLDGGAGSPVMSDDREWFAFSSDDDLTGDNADHSFEVFLLRRSTGAVSQLTDGVADLGEGTGISGNPDISANGRYVTFESDLDVTGDNADLSAEVFLYDRVADQTTQLSDIADGEDGGRYSRNPAISADGTTVVFESNANLTGSNAELVSELFRYVVGDEVLAQATDLGVDANLDPSISGNGGVVAFSSYADPFGLNLDDGYEVFTLTGAAVQQVTQASEDGVSNPLISRDGQHVGYHEFDGETHFRDSLVIEELGGSTELIVPSSAGEVSGMSVSADADRVVFSTDADLAGDNPDGGFELFVHDRSEDTTVQLTDTPGGDSSASDVAMTGDGEHFAFSSTVDPLGENGDGDVEVFLVSCDGSGPPTGFSDVSPTHPFAEEIQWMADQGISEGYPDGTYRPAANVTRQAMSAFMYRLAGSPTFTPAGTTFTDVSAAHPFYAEIEWMADTEISEGYPDGTYRPGAVVTRQAMSAFMYRLAGSPTFTPAGTTFTDVSAAHPFYAEVEWMADEGISEGYQPGPTYRPGNAVTRQAMSAFMKRLAEGPGVGILPPD